MTRTHPAALIIAAVLGGGLGFLFDMMLTSTGRPTFSPSIMLPIMLVLLGVLCVALAWPIRRAVRDRKAAPVNPFRAMRVAVLAKASAIAGAVLAGIAGGLVTFVMTRPVAPGLGSWGTSVATLVASILLVVAALVAEWLCTLPKDPDDRQPDDPVPGAESHA